MKTLKIPTKKLNDLFLANKAVLNAGNGGIPFNNHRGYTLIKEEQCKFFFEFKGVPFINCSFEFYSEDGELIYNDVGGLVESVYNKNMAA